MDRLGVCVVLDCQTPPPSSSRCLSMAKLAWIFARQHEDLVTELYRRLTLACGCSQVYSWH